MRSMKVRIMMALTSVSWSEIFAEKADELSQRSTESTEAFNRPVM